MTERIGPVRGLMYRMARALGVELSEAQARGRIRRETVARMDRHCLACSDQEDCAHRLAAAHETLPEPPDYCPNRKLLLALKPVKPAPEDPAP